MRWLRRIGWVLATVVASLLTLWAASAIYFDSPLAGLRAVAAVAYLIVVLVVMALLRRRGVGMLVPFVGFALVAVWWFSLKPSSDRNWQPDDVQMAYADINGDQVTIHNFRNRHTEPNRTTPAFGRRAVKLGESAGADISITWWGSPGPRIPSLAQISATRDTSLCRLRRATKLARNTRRWGIFPPVWTYLHRQR